MIMLGALVESAQCVKLDSIFDALKYKTSESQPNILEANLKATSIVANYMRSLLQNNRETICSV
ncbi:hypothetical protein DSOL_3651 [Desulfosporosinus metallidurans]|uniref:Uncharacterized protein n=2 Tax=Desulfosporosinus metallidurans TaxID=1888891 RepID=A0A1Q8QPD8_9FIRM|nr:hypothetical protein DSOL_3651 [Desulfosporosinus metallidurans]